MTPFFLCFYVLSTVLHVSDSSADEWFQTPHGLRPKECIVNHDESNVIINEVDDGLNVFYPISNTTKFYPTSQKCIENAKDILSKMSKKRHDGKKINHPDDGWEIYAHYGQNNLGRMDSVYILPNQDLPLTNQLLYYFIGLTNFQPNNETIIQPVIAWCGSSSCGYSYDYSGWEMAAWNCCPKGLSNYGKGVKLSKGDTVTTFVESNPSGGNIQVYMSANAGVSQLNENYDYRIFNDAEVTGEFYRYNDCNQFNSDPIRFTQISLKDTSGNNVVIPKWTVINDNPLDCGGNITFVSATEVTIAARS